MPPEAAPIPLCSHCKGELSPDKLFSQYYNFGAIAYIAIICIHCKVILAGQIIPIGAQEQPSSVVMPS